MKFHVKLTMLKIWWMSCQSCFLTPRKITGKKSIEQQSTTSSRSSKTYIREQIKLTGCTLLRDIYFVELYGLNVIMCVKWSHLQKKIKHFYERSEFNSISIWIHYICVLRLIKHVQLQSCQDCEYIRETVWLIHDHRSLIPAATAAAAHQTKFKLVLVNFLRFFRATRWCLVK